MVQHGYSNVVDLAAIRQDEADRRLLEQIVAECHPALAAFVAPRVVGLNVDAEDVCQEVFLRLVKNAEVMNRVRTGEVRPRSYLFRMANNIVIDLTRRSSLHRNYEQVVRNDGLDVGSSMSIGPEKVAIGMSDLEQVKVAIKEMEPAWRQAFLLNRYSGLSYREISDHMGASRKQVENFMAKALVRIRAVKESWIEGDEDDQQ